MAIYVQDTFTDTDGTQLSAHSPDIGGAWSAASGVTIQTDELQYGFFVAANVPVNATLAGSDDYDTSMDIVMNGSSAGGDFLGVVARGNPGLGNFYAAYYNANYGGTAEQVRLSVYTGDVETILGTFALPYVQGQMHNIKLRVLGTTISCLVDDVTQISVTDITYPNNQGTTTIGILGATSFPQSILGDNFIAQSSPAIGAWTLITRTGQGSSDTNGFTTTGIDTTGANLIVVAVNYNNGPPTLSDSKGNTWTAAVGPINNNSFCSTLYYSLHPTVGIGHTFTVSGTAESPDVFVQAWSGAASSSVLDQTNYGTGPFVTPLQTGSVTPGVDGELIVAACFSGDTTVSSTINDSFTVTDAFPQANSQHFGGGMAFLVQGTSAAVNPSWADSGSLVNAYIATFKPGTGGPPPNTNGFFRLMG